MQYAQRRTCQHREAREECPTVATQESGPSAGGPGALVGAGIENSYIAREYARQP